MAQIAVTPIVLKDVTLTIGGTNTYEKHVDQVVFTPSASTQSWTGLALNTYTSTTTATWTCNLQYAQDFDTTDSLSLYLHNNEGSDVALVFVPVSGGATFTTTVSISPGAIGGNVNQYATASVTLGCTKPVIS